MAPSATLESLLESDPVLESCVLDHVTEPFQWPVALHHAGVGARRIATMTFSEAEQELRSILAGAELGDPGAGPVLAARRLIETTAGEYEDLMAETDLLLFARAYPASLLHRRLERAVERARRQMADERRRREAPQPPGRLPDFLVVGAPKCGTTTLYTALAGQPDVFLPIKEQEFFSSERYFRPAAFFAQFADAPPNALWGDVSVGALADRLAIARVKTRYGARRPKILVCAREPLARALSHYLHRAARQWLPGSFATCCRYIELRHTFVETGNFAAHVRAWQSAVGAANVKVVLLDDLRRERAREALDGVCRFLGLGVFVGPLPGIGNARRDVDNPALHRLGLAMHRYADDLPLVRAPAALVDALARTWPRSQRRSCEAPIAVPPAIRERLSRFRSDAEALFGRSFAIENAVPAS